MLIANIAKIGRSRGIPQAGQRFLTNICSVLHAVEVDRPHVACGSSSSAPARPRILAVSWRRTRPCR
jgi:hypothetical protein